MSNENNMEAAKANLAAKRAAKHMPITVEPPPAALVPVASGMTSLQIVQNTPALEKLGEVFAASGFFGAVTKSTATAALVNCFIEGLSPVEYKAKYHTMNDGTTSIKSDYIQREFHRLGGAWKFNEWTPEVCDITFTYRGSELRGRVTIDEFKQNGVAIGKSGIKDNWRKFPREMLKARCMATYIRALCPEALGGMYTQEETMDFNAASAPRVITPAAEKPAAKPEVVTPEVVEPPPPADPNVCPCGKSKGKRFEDLPTDTLEKILDNAAKYPAITDAHKAAIVAVLQEREAEG